VNVTNLSHRKDFENSLGNNSMLTIYILIRNADPLQ
jgi:hypothetical protein